MNEISALFGLDKTAAPLSYSSLTLAFIGDAVFDLLTRSMVIAGGGFPVNELNKRAAAVVRATNQAKMYDAVSAYGLTDEEQGVLRRGRNANPHARAKNATMAEYRHATAVEALFGYLFLSGETERLRELFEAAVAGGAEFDRQSQ